MNELSNKLSLVFAEFAENPKKYLERTARAKLTYEDSLSSDSIVSRLVEHYESNNREGSDLLQ